MRLAVFGALGGVGLEVVKQAEAWGHEVVALARRRPDVASHAGVPTGALWLPVDVTDRDAVRRVLDRPLDAIAWCVGVTKQSGPGVGAAALPVVVNAAEEKGIARLVAVSGAAVTVSGESKSLPARAASTITRRLAPAVVKDKQAELDALARSSLSWTVVRPPRLSNDLLAAWRLDAVAPGFSAKPVPRASLAEAVVELAEPYGFEAAKWSRQAPFIWV